MSKKNHPGAPDAHVLVSNACAIGIVDGDRVYIRKTLVALLMVPTWPVNFISGVRETSPVEIMSIKPGHFAVDTNGCIIHNVGMNWVIKYHVRTYVDRKAK